MNSQPTCLFANACGQTEGFGVKVYRNGEYIDGRDDVSKPYMLIGRHAKADLFLDDEKIGRRHAYFQLIDGCCYFLSLRDSDYRSGWVAECNRATIDPLTFEISPGFANAKMENVNPLASGSATHLAKENAFVEFLNTSIRRSGDRSWELDRLITIIGRSRQCKVRIKDASLSLFHCSLIRTRHGMWAVDLLGRGGISVNGQKMTFGCLEDGDILKVGRIKMRIGVPVPPKRQDGNPTEDGLAIQEKKTHSANGQLVNSSENRAVSLLANGHPQTSLGSIANQNGVDGLLLPVLEQFSNMQNQMFEQFQQTILMVAQSFRGLHDEQAKLVREELHTLQQLNKELFTLQAEMSKVSTIGHQDVAHVQTEVDRTSTTKSLPKPQDMNDSTLDASHSDESKHAETKSNNGSEARDLPVIASGAELPERPPPDMPEKEVHNWISSRLQNLEKKRQNSWQRLFSYLSGK